MAEPDVQIPADSDDEVIQDFQPHRDPAVDQEPPPPVDEPTAPPSVASQDTPNDEMAVWILLESTLELISIAHGLYM